MNKDIIIPKTQKKEETIARHQLKEIKEFDKDEQIGILTMWLNEMIKDRLNAEMMKRSDDMNVDMARSKTAIEQASSEQTKSGKLVKNLETHIKFCRQLIEEVRDGRFVI